MSQNSQIGWCDDTFNPWWGCTKVSSGCAHCYAEGIAKRFGGDIWGANAGRRVFAESHWQEPRKWDRQAQRAGVRRRVFCGSMCDVFEDHAVAQRERPKLWDLIDRCPNLDWLLLTKRPENIPHMLPPGDWPNIWPGTSCENQATANERIQDLLKCPAAIHFLSLEPLLGPIDFLPWTEFGLRCACDWQGHERLKGLPEWADDADFGYRCPKCLQKTCHLPIDETLHSGSWVIVGGESGPGFRESKIEWQESIAEQCQAAGVPLFIKQDSGLRPGLQGRIPDRLWRLKQFPRTAALEPQTASPA